MYSKHSHHASQAPVTEGLHTSLAPLQALAVLQRVIVDQLDPDASVCQLAGEQALRWTSPELSEPVTVTALEEVTATGLWFECSARDLSLCILAKRLFAHAEAQDSLPAALPRPAETVREVVDDLMADPTWSTYVHVLPEALETADDCPYLQLERLQECLKALAVFAGLRRTSIGRSAEHLAGECCLANVYRPHISFTASNRYRQDYVARWNGAQHVLREHLTLGGGCNDRHCMSVHFIWDAASGRIVIGRLGRHGTNTLTNT